MCSGFFLYFSNLTQIGWLINHRHQCLLTLQMNLFILSPSIRFYIEKMNTSSKMIYTLYENDIFF